jgi:hypothetical protein
MGCANIIGVSDSCVRRTYANVKRYGSKACEKEKVKLIFVCALCRTGRISKEGADSMTCSGKKDAPHPEVAMVRCGGVTTAATEYVKQSS